MAALNLVQASNLNTPDFEVGTRVPNKITMRGSTIVGVAVDNTAKTITFTAADATTTSVSLAAVDISVDAAASTYDATTNILTLKQKNGGADVVIDLSDLQKAAVANGNGIKITGDGADATPLKAEIVIDPASSTALTVGTGGLKLDAAGLLPVEIKDAFGTHLGYVGA